MRSLIFAVCANLALLSTAAHADQRPDGSPISYAGEALNLSVGVPAKMTLEISALNDETWIASGEFDNENLVGSFKASGREVYGCAEEHVCLQFFGVLNGLEPGGFPEGTAATFELSLMFPPDDFGQGVYRIGALPSFDVPQFGRLLLARIPK